MSRYRKITNRKPPKPKSWNASRGTCRFCGAGIFNADGTRSSRRNWHPQCVHEWKIMNDPKYARAYVWDHFRGICQGCGKSEWKTTWTETDKWEVDHIEPLFLAEGDLTYYAKENMVLLCTPCHKKKTLEDMRVYRSIADNSVYLTSESN